MGRTAKAAVAREQRGSTDGDKRAQRTQSLHELELKHHQSGYESDMVVKDEDTRRLRVRILLLRDENTALRDQVSCNDSANATLVSRCDNLNAQVEANMALVRSQEEQLRKQEREYASLKAELDAMNNANESSANVLAEKLALTRELANLKPEIEHLRSQVNHQQAILAEKLSLERQVDTLEVELANEKKATRRAMQARQSNDRVEDELRKKLRETEKSLTAEKAERERLEDQLEQRIRTHEMALQDQDSTRELEADLRKKLQEAQRQLREETEEKERLDEELQTAQRASKKSQQSKADKSVEAELRAQLEESEENLAKLQRQSEKRQQEHQTAMSELGERNEQLEKKLEKARTKLRTALEEIKRMQTETRKAPQQQARSSGSEDTMKPATKSQAFRKRKAQETTTSEFTGIEIQTPSADDGMKARRAVKKVVFEPTVVEKSAFSITPFLNRSKNTSMSDEASNVYDGVLEDSILGSQPGSASSRSTSSRAAEPAAAAAADPTEAEPTTTTTTTTTTAPAEAEEESEAAGKSRGRPKKILGDAPSAKKNVLPKKKVKAAKSGLERVAEAADEPKQQQQQENTAEAVEAEPAETKPTKKKKTAAAAATVRFNVAASPPAEEEAAAVVVDAGATNAEAPKKKKRKVLGSTKTLFDEDDGAVPTAAPAAVVRKPAAASKVQLGGGAKRTKAPLGGGQRNAFAGTASFSPLKRDRRGVGASFLA
ncbi:putative rossmann-fold NAD (+)-binding protein [Rosellinia necatrix]|uniref:Putative rossmann-fold NAD (+)-binding protein n=1 Tax=Rosellinia necatrix TaxID=77044 RepID=A0A1S7UIL6_ROSNE|nr:putative rossmann-fold NAD (+)-binding protein [Rosellinia necatrix]